MCNFIYFYFYFLKKAHYYYLCYYCNWLHIFQYLLFNLVIFGFKISLMWNGILLLLDCELVTHSHKINDVLFSCQQDIRSLIIALGSFRSL